MVQEPGLCVPSAEGPGLIPGQGTGFCMLQLKILYVATKTWAQPNKEIYMKKKLSIKRMEHSLTLGFFALKDLFFNLVILH